MRGRKSRKFHWRLTFARKGFDWQLISARNLTNHAPATTPNKMPTAIRDLFRLDADNVVQSIHHSAKLTELGGTAFRVQLVLKSRTSPSLNGTYTIE